MPAGLQTITPSQGGRGVTVEVRVDRAAAAALEAQRAALEARRKRPYFDFNHEDGEASFWPTEFYWVGDERAEMAERKWQMAARVPASAPAAISGPAAISVPRSISAPPPDALLSSLGARPPGIYARGEWSDLGEQAISGKRYRQFSPVFYVDDVRAHPARIVCREDAKPNMGGLVNDPAFHTILPFWAKDAGASGTTQKPQPGHRPNSDQPMTHEEIAGLRARLTSLEQQNAALEARDTDDVTRLSHQAELKAARAELAAGEAQRQAETLRARNDALEAAESQRRQASARQYAADMVARGALAARDHAGIAEVERNMASNPEVFAPIYARWASNPALGGRSSFTGSRYSGGGISVTHSDPRKVFGALGALCARQSDESLHVLTRMEVAREFGAIYAREFRGENGKRILDAPLSAADSTDPSTHLGTLAGSLVTQRTLELLRTQFPVLGRITTDFSDLPAQFNQTIISRIIDIPAAQDYDPDDGWNTDASAVTHDVPIKIDKHKGVPITFNQNILASTVRRLFEEFAPASSYALARAMVDDLYANITDVNFTNNTVQATNTFARQHVISMGTALTLRGVPQGDMNRTLLLYPTVFGNLAQDQNLVSFAAFQRPDLFERGSQDTAFAFPVHGFSVYEAQNLPTNNGNVTGFGFSKSALVLAARVPNDYTSVLPGAGNGNVQVITDPDLGLSVMLVQYVDHKKGTATQRIALMYGTAAGQPSAGQILKAASGTGTGR